MNPLLVTGAAGFIGMHVCESLLMRGQRVVGVDNLNAYYDVALKQARLARLHAHPGFSFERTDLADRTATAALFERLQPRRVLHLAAQAGVRHSIEYPQVHIDANLVGFANLLEGCRVGPVEHLVYASSSSVYGSNTRLPFHERGAVDHPINLYAASKKANELMAHAYSHLHRIPATGLRYFTVYGPWGRPDMALYRFTEAIATGRPIDVHGHGNMVRDFTYIDDVVEATLRVLDKPATADPASGSTAPYRIFNIGNNKPTGLLDCIAAIEAALGVTAMKRWLPVQPGDMPATAADTSALADWVGFTPATPIDAGINHFVHWFKDFHTS